MRLSCYWVPITIHMVSANRVKRTEITSAIRYGNRFQKRKDARQVQLARDDVLLLRLGLVVREVCHSILANCSNPAPKHTLFSVPPPLVTYVPPSAFEREAEKKTEH